MDKRLETNTGLYTGRAQLASSEKQGEENQNMLSFHYISKIHTYSLHLQIRIFFY